MTMAQTVGKSDLKNSKVKVSAKYLRISPQKLNLTARLIRNLNVESALNVLTFSRKRISIDVKKLLMSAIANAQHNYNLDIDKLYVSEAFVGRSVVMKRLMYKSKGKGEQMHKPFSNMTIVLSERNTLVEKNNKVKNVEVK